MIKQPHVAVLDDDRSVRTAIGRLLKTSGMHVVCHASSLALLNAVRRDPPDCIVLDLQMPGMNGMDVLNYLAHANMRLPVVIITAHDERRLTDACLAAGAFACLHKPLDADELIATIGKAIREFRKTG